MPDIACNHSPIEPAARGRARLVMALMVLFLTVGVGLAAVTAVLIMRAAAWHGGPIEEWLLDKGPDRVMRRCIFVWGMIFLGIFLKRAGWRGWRDSGMSEDPSAAVSPFWPREVGIGLGIGILSLGVMSVMAWWLDARVFTPPPDWAVMPRRAASYIASGITVGLLEEIICRGILFRLFKRLWSFWPAALFSSALFAAAHFLSPAPEMFDAAALPVVAGRVYLDTFAGALRNTTFWLRLLNLTLLGMVLCAFLERSGNIWRSVGAHTGWVWVIKFHAFLTMADQQHPAGVWFGARADFTDGWLATGLMLGLLLYSWPHARPAVLLRGGRLLWRAAAEHKDLLARWLHDNAPAVAAGKYPWTADDTPGRVLKAYDGCRVTALDGLVVKAYWPRQGWRGRRFAWRPCRVRRNFEMAAHLRAIGISTPDALAWSVARRHGLRRVEYLLTGELVGRQPLTGILTAPSGDAAGLMRAYGGMMGRFHRNRYYNRDFKHENLMSGGNPGDLWVVDLDGVRRLPWITRRRAGRDLWRVGDCLHSLGRCEPGDVRSFFEGYNAIVPRRLQRQEFPGISRA